MSGWDPTWMPRFPHTVLPTEEEWPAILRHVGWNKTAEAMERQIAEKGLGSVATEVAETSAATVGAESAAVTSAEVAGETLLGAAAEGGLAVGGTVGAAGGFEIPVWGWVATGVAAAAGAAYGIYKHYQHKREVNGARVEKRTERRHFNKAQLIETQHIVAGTATVAEVKDVQRELKAEGFDIGKYGAKKDGVDGIAGPMTRKALTAALIKP